MTKKQPLTVLIVYDTHEFGSALAHALERLGIALPPELAERHALFTWLAGGHCYKQNEARRTMKALDGLGHAVHIADIRDLRLNSANDLLLHKGRPVDLSGFDAAWLRLAGRHDKSWLLPAAPRPAYFGIIDHIERRLPVITPFAKAVAMDGKVETQRFLERHNLPSPRSLTLTQAEESGGAALDARIDAFMNAYAPGAFFVLKKDRGSMGHRAPYRKTPNAWDNFQSEIWGIFIHDDPALVRARLKKWLQAPSSNGVVLQEFIPSARKERRVEVFVTPRGAEILHACERGKTGNVTLAFDAHHLAHGDFSFETDTVRIMDERDKDLALRAAIAAGEGRWGIDLIGDPPCILELNPFSTMRTRLQREERLGRSDAFFRQVARAIETTVETLKQPLSDPRV